LAQRPTPPTSLRPAAGQRCPAMRSGIVVLAVACLLVVAGASQAQNAAPTANEAERNTQLIEAMLSKGMTPAVQAFLAQPPTDPELATGVRDGIVKAYLPTLRSSPEKYLQTVRDVVSYQRRMYADQTHADYWARPKWGADLAQELLINALPDMYLAGAFATLGFPDESQRKAVNLISTESIELLDRAEDEFFNMKTTLRGREDFVSEYVNTGHWAELQRYQQLNIPYNRAWAVVYVLTQSDDGPYFSETDDVESARESLIRKGKADVEVAADKARAMGLPADIHARMDLLRAHLAIYEGRYDTARQHAQDARARNGARAYTRFLAQLTYAKALHKAGNVDRLKSLLDGLEQDPITRQNPLHAVLVTDRRFMIIYDQANQVSDPVRKREIISKAFDVYVQLLNSDLIADRYRGAIRTYVEDRYQQQIPAGMDAGELPGPLQLAAVRATFEAGEELRKQGKAQQAVQRYTEAVEMAGKLRQREKLTPATKVQTLFYCGYAQLRARESLSAARTFIQLADEFPDRARGEQAINIALVNIIQPELEKKADEQALQRLAERAYDILFQKYPNIDLARVATYDYAAFLRQTEQYAKAVRAYADVPSDHEAYLSALYERLSCLGVLWQEADAGHMVRQHARDIINGVEQFLREVPDRLGRLPAERRQTIQRYIVQARLLRVRVRLETFDQSQQAMDELDEIRAQYGDMEQIQTRIQGVIIRAYQKQNKFDLAEKELEQYMQRKPEKAGPLALGILQSINEQIKNEDDPQRVNMLAGVAVNLSRDIVLPWARTQDPNTETMISYELMPAESLMAAGKWKEALDQFEKIVKRHGKPAENKMEIVEGMAECHAELGSVAQAQKRYNKIIRFYQETGESRDKHYWNAQMRVYQMMDQFAAKKGNVPNTQIYRGIRILTQRYPDLGGEPYASELKRLQNKHAPR